MQTVVFLVVGLVILVVTGIVYETLAARAAWQAHPPPGERVDVGGYRLHLHVEGGANGGPTVILDHGGSSMSAPWAWIRTGLAEDMRVVAYDRPGMGWSDAPPEPVDAVQAVHDLHLALQSLGVEGPYVLVGHSMGALTVRVFAQLYPDEVAGLVLLDPRDVTWEGVYEQEPQMSPAAAAVIKAAGRVGLVRLLGRFSPDLDGLPAQERAQVESIANSHHHMGSLEQEGQIGDSAAAWLIENEEMLDVPLLVLSAGEAGGGFDQAQRAGLTALHERLAARAPQGERRILSGANHVTLVTHAGPAGEVAQAISDWLLAIGQGSDR
jgi:pimeloyl-ACP methyl ester carboxylesterase